ncbi:MOSC domain-containing protein [Naumannella sp. ID2617S]|uniref:MOSC domain-containing protein n=1 Tax=Enemella dayhoffiae TaxID=2016507 RepID=A0A255GRN2_9ACTN|nr:MOSC domain-containing protein [Naumannella sp. ID2617S]OYO18459.1 MOSC domain-containing protein [Enemella dayhoffiae]
MNVAQAERSPAASARTGLTGIRKRPVARCEVRDPGSKDPARGGLGSGLVGDFIGDQRHHGGDEQAVYAYAREDLDWFAERLGRTLPDGVFGENLTTVGLDVNGALLGEVWRIGEVELRVTCGRIPCRTFAGELGRRGWVKEFTAEARVGAYLAVQRPGTLVSGAPIEVIHRPGHEVTVELWFRAVTTERGLMPRLAAAGADLPSDTRAELRLQS